jgi:hypothetical protein
MNPRITFDYFQGELLITNLTGDGDYISARGEDLLNFITPHELEYLEHLLGEDLYQEFADALDTAGNLYASLAAKWQALLLKIYPQDQTASPAYYYSPAAGYVYFVYNRYQQSITTDGGQVTAKFENAEMITNWNKMTFAWNRMVSLSEIIREWIVDNIATYDTYSPPVPDPLVRINRIGI